MSSTNIKQAAVSFMNGSSTFAKSPMTPVVSPGTLSRAGGVATSVGRKVSQITKPAVVASSSGDSVTGSIKTAKDFSNYLHTATKTASYAFKFWALNNLQNEDLGLLVKAAMAAAAPQVTNKPGHLEEFRNQQQRAQQEQAAPAQPAQSGQDPDQQQNPQSPLPPAPEISPHDFKNDPIVLGIKNRVMERINKKRKKLDEEAKHYGTGGAQPQASQPQAPQVPATPPPKSV